MVSGDKMIKRGFIFHAVLAPDTLNEVDDPPAQLHGGEGFGSNHNHSIGIRLSGLMVRPVIGNQPLGLDDGDHVAQEEYGLLMGGF